MTLSELKLRRLTGQHLLRPADVQTVLRDLCGVQAQFLSHAVHALTIRSGDVSPMAMDDVIKSWTLRGTMHLFSRADLPLMLYRERTHALRPCDTLSADESISAERKAFFAAAIVEAVDRGVCDREALKRVCEDAGMTETEAKSVFDPWGGLIRALCEAGEITHAVSEQKAYRRCPPFEPMARDTARLELMRRYLTHYGPVTVRDAAYFFRWTQAEVKKIIGQLSVQAAICDGKTVYYMEETPLDGARIPDCIFLAGFDPLMLGYEKTENPFLPPAHLRGIFNLSGIVMPAVLLRGRVVGRWKRTGKRLNIALFETVSLDEEEIIIRCAAQTFQEALRVVIGGADRADAGQW